MEGLDNSQAIRQIAGEVRRLETGARDIQTAQAGLAKLLELETDPTRLDVIQTRLLALSTIAAKIGELARECRTLLGLYLPDHRAVGGDRSTAAQPASSVPSEVRGNTPPDGGDA